MHFPTIVDPRLSDQLELAVKVCRPSGAAISQSDFQGLKSLAKLCRRSAARK